MHSFPIESMKIYSINVNRFLTCQVWYYGSILLFQFIHLPQMSEHFGQVIDIQHQMVISLLNSDIVSRGFIWENNIKQDSITTKLFSIIKDNRLIKYVNLMQYVCSFSFRCRPQPRLSFYYLEKHQLKWKTIWIFTSKNITNGFQIYIHLSNELLIIEEMLIIFRIVIKQNKYNLTISWINIGLIKPCLGWCELW